MAFRYDYFEKKREAIFRTINQHQPVSLLRLTALLAPTYKFDAIKKELWKLVAENSITKRRAHTYKNIAQHGGNGFLYSIPEEETKQ